jgi:hypothetical protein
MIHALEIGLALSLVSVVAGLVVLAPRPKPVPIRIHADHTRRQRGV